MRVVYRGPSPRVFVPRPGLPDVEFPHGEPVEVPEQLGQVLVESPVFTPAEARGGPKPPKSAGPAEGPPPATAGESEES